MLLCSPCPLYCSVVPALKPIILISSYLISFIYFNHSVQEAPVILRASAFSWHSGRDIHTTVLNDCAGVQALRAHLRRAAGPFDLWILQMKSRGETETNHLWFWESFRSDWLFILIGGEKGLIFARAVRFRFSITVMVEFPPPPKTYRHKLFQSEKMHCSDNQSVRPAACGWLWSLNGLALWQSKGRRRVIAFVCPIN